MIYLFTTVSAWLSMISSTGQAFEASRIGSCRIETKKREWLDSGLRLVIKKHNLLKIRKEYFTHFERSFCLPGLNFHAPAIAADALPDRWITSRWAAGLIWITKSVRRCVCFSSRIWLVRFGVSAVTSSERLLGLSFKLKNFKMKNEHLKWLKTIRMDRIGVNLPIFVR